MSGAATFLAPPDAEYTAGGTVFVDGGLLGSHHEQSAQVLPREVRC